MLWDRIARHVEQKQSSNPYSCLLLIVVGA
nr:MAG TPA: hypothetical protein [Caudoviricetes sp.]